MKSDDLFYMKLVGVVAQRSRAVRKQVGAVAVRGRNIIGYGWNGTPSGDDNCCEDKTYMPPKKAMFVGEYQPDPSDYPYEDEHGRYYLTTKDSVVHAEENAVCKIAESTESSSGATMYTTLAPCIRCSRMMYSSGFVRLVYGENYRDPAGIDFLKSKGVDVVQCVLEQNSMEPTQIALILGFIMGIISGLIFMYIALYQPFEKTSRSTLEAPGFFSRCVGIIQSIKRLIESFKQISTRNQ